MRHPRIRLALYGLGIVVGLLVTWAGWQAGQWSLVFLGASQVLVWSVHAVRSLGENRQPSAPINHVPFDP